MPQLLIIDDQPPMRRAIARMLPFDDYVFTFAESAEQALSYLGEKTFDAVVSDLHLDGLSGMDLLRYMRDHNHSTPVILMTGAPDLRSASRAVELGAFRYFLKPVCRDQFIDAVAEAISSSQERAAKGRSDDRQAALTATIRDVLDSLQVEHQPVVGKNSKPFGFETKMHSLHPTLTRPTRIVDLAIQCQMLEELGSRVRQLAIAPLLLSEDNIIMDLNAAELNSGSIYNELLITQHADRIILKLRRSEDRPFALDARAHVDQLRACGFRIMIDNLGMDRAPLTSIAAIQPEIVKLDARLVRYAPRSTAHHQHILSVIELCHDMGTQVIADGVGAAHQQQSLAALGCDLFMGPLYGYSEVMDDSGVKSWMHPFPGNRSEQMQHLAGERLGPPAKRLRVVKR